MKGDKITIYSSFKKIVYNHFELLPENQQEKIAEHLREYIADLEDEIRWDNKFRNTQSELSKIAKEVRKEISEGKAQGFDYEKL